MAIGEWGRFHVPDRWYYLPQRRRLSMAQPDVSQQQRDEALLQKFGYKQELQRTLGFLSNFAVAFVTS